jgi:hypothetical protein
MGSPLPRNFIVTGKLGENLRKEKAREREP